MLLGRSRQLDPVELGRCEGMTSDGQEWMLLAELDLRPPDWGTAQPAVQATVILGSQHEGMDLQPICAVLQQVYFRWQLDLSISFCSVLTLWIASFISKDLSVLILIFSGEHTGNISEMLTYSSLYFSLFSVTEVDYIGLLHATVLCWCFPRPPAVSFECWDWWLRSGRQFEALHPRKKWLWLPGPAFGIADRIWLCVRGKLHVNVTVMCNAYRLTVGPSYIMCTSGLVPPQERRMAVFRQHPKLLDVRTPSFGDVEDPLEMVQMPSDAYKHSL